MARMEPDSSPHRPEKEGPGADQSNLYEIEPPDALDAGVSFEAAPEDIAPDAPAAAEPSELDTDPVVTPEPLEPAPSWLQPSSPEEHPEPVTTQIVPPQAEAFEPEPESTPEPVREWSSPDVAAVPTETPLPEPTVPDPTAGKPAGYTEPEPEPGSEPEAGPEPEPEPEPETVDTGVTAPKPTESFDTAVALHASAGQDETTERLPHSPDASRREFFRKAAAVVVGGAVVGVPVVAGLSVLLDPLRRGAAGNAPYLPVAPLDAVPADGSPMQFPVKADRTDAWNQFRNVPIGAVFLKRVGDAVKAFNVVCPHAGCFVQPRPDGSFLCPCHNSGFHPDGSLAPHSVSPRGLDELEAKLDGQPGQQVVLVRFQNFQPATTKKLPV
jgi:menaquinol-cytochrome c reductase iron-sulfur subunit